MITVSKQHLTLVASRAMDEAYEAVRRCRGRVEEVRSLIKDSDDRVGALSPEIRSARLGVDMEVSAAVRAIRRLEDLGEEWRRAFSNAADNAGKFTGFGPGDEWPPPGEVRAVFEDEETFFKELLEAIDQAMAETRAALDEAEGTAERLYEWLE